MKKYKEYKESWYEHNYFPVKDNSTSLFNKRYSTKDYFTNKKINKMWGKWLLILILVIFAFFLSKNFDIYYYNYLIKIEKNIIEKNNEFILNSKKQIKVSENKLKCYKNQKERLEKKEKISFWFCNKVLLK